MLALNLPRTIIRFMNTAPGLLQLDCMSCNPVSKDAMQPFLSSADAEVLFNLQGWRIIISHPFHR